MGRRVRGCDVLVIGLGPAGASAARVAARAGCSVLAIERKKVVGIPVQCAEFIPLPLSGYAGTEARAQPISGMATYLPSGTRTERPFAGLMIRRDRFDQALARKAEEAGAVLWTDCALKHIDLAARTATVSTALGLRDIRFSALVAADGPLSAVADCLGMSRLPVVTTRQYTVALLEPHADTDIWLSGRYPGGYAWLFPKGSVANLGLGLDPRNEQDMKAPLDALHAELIAAGRVSREVLLRTGGPIPVGGMRDPMVLDSVLFAGDAAGLTHPITGAGIAPAVVSGERAGAAAASGRFAGYEEEMREDFGPAIARALVARRRMAAVWGSERAQHDSAHRAGWIAFDEYFKGTPA